MLILENAHQRISLDPTTGALASLVALPRGREYLGPVAQPGPFVIWHGFRELYRFTAPRPGAACDQPPDPSAIASGRFGPGRLIGSTVGRGTATLRYADTASGLEARVEVRLDGERSRWTLTATNRGAEPVEIMATFPLWDGLTLRREAGGRMLAMNQSGYVSSLWHHPGGLYGHATQQSAQFGCLFERQTGDCFGFYVEDPDCGA